MKTAIRTVSLLMMGLLLNAPGAMAQNETADAIRQLIRTMNQQWRDGDYDAYLNNIAIGADRFNANGGPRTTPATQEELAAAAEILEGAHQAGARSTTIPKSIDVRVYGSTAVATYYFDGDITDIRGVTRHVMRRRTQIFVEDVGQWKVVHTHTSNMQSVSN